MKSFDPKNHPIPIVHQLLLSGVAPRPIAFVSSLDKDGGSNLSPFSYFNAFGANPPVVVISPAYRGHDGTPKHTFLNIKETHEFTVNMVSYAMLEQANLASSDYASGVDEFVKAGFTKRPSQRVAPPGVAESPFIMECKLLHHFDTGGKPGAGNLLIGEVVMFHVSEDVYTDERIDPRKLDLVARMGYDWYCRANGDALFHLPKPKSVGIGFDNLPAHLRTSAVLTGSDLAKLAGSEALLVLDVERALSHPVAREVLNDDTSGIERLAMRLHEEVRRLLSERDAEMAWQLALLSEPQTLRSLRKNS